jgi:hypothetical protein
MKSLRCSLMMILVFGLNTGCRPEYPQRSTAQLTLRLVDDDGQPVPQAKVAVVGFHVAAEGKTDNSGCYLATLRTVSGEVDFEVDKAGYYSINRQTYLFSGQTNGQFFPWNPLVELQFHKIGKPVPMFVKSVKGLPIPVKDQAVGYDLLVSDWVSPYGKGEISDFIFAASSSITDANNYNSRMLLTFSNPGDGLILRRHFYRDDLDLRLPAIAPVTGYRDRWEFVLNAKTNLISGGRQTTETASNDDNYYFRVRSKQDGNGNVISGMYGKIYYGISFEPGFWHERKPTLFFQYYLNPDGTRNTEFSGKNLCPHPGDVSKGH